MLEHGRAGRRSAALSVAGAIFLILELNDPYRGLIRIPDEPLRNPLESLFYFFRS